MPTTFSLTEVAAGVWAAIAPSLAGPAVSNAAIIDLGDKTVVFDTFMTMAAASELGEEVRRLTGRQPYLVVNSHWHSDHVRGNRAFAQVPIVGTERMRELIFEDSPKTRQEFADRVASIQAWAEERAASAAGPEEEQAAAGTRALAGALAAESDGYRLTLPDVLIGDRLDIEGERSLTILGYGNGHTESDLFAHIPAENVVVAGDLVWAGVHPKANDGFPAQWAAVVDRIADLAPTVVVPGHGPPGGPAEVAAMADYLRRFDEVLAAVVAGDVDPAAADPPTGSEEWAGRDRYRSSLQALLDRTPD